MLRAIVPGDPEQSAENLIREVENNPSPLPIPVLRPFNQGHARTKLQLAALAALKPRSWTTGEVLDLLALCEQPEGPAQQLLPVSQTLPEARSLAARFLYPALPRRELLDQLKSCQNEEAFDSHLISIEALTALRRKEARTFLELRERDLASYVSGYLSSRAVWHPADRDRTSLARLIVEDSE